jgi:hypothetical protein
MYTPCEIALAEFTFLDGVRRVYHTLINPGEYMTVAFCLIDIEFGCSEHDFQQDPHVAM